MRSSPPNVNPATAASSMAGTARQRMRDHERNSWSAAECDDGPEHISTILARVLVGYAKRGLDVRGTVA